MKFSDFVMIFHQNDPKMIPDRLLTVDSHSSFLAPKDVPGGGENRQMMGEMCRGTQKRQTNPKKDKLIQKKTN